VSVDIDLLKLRFQNMSEEQILTKVEKAWGCLMNGLLCEEEDIDLHIIAAASFVPGLIKAELIPDSLRVSSIESIEIVGDEDD